MREGWEKRKEWEEAVGGTVEGSRRTLSWHEFLQLDALAELYHGTGIVRTAVRGCDISRIYATMKKVGNVLEEDGLTVADVVTLLSYMLCDTATRYFYNQLLPSKEEAN